MWRRIATLLNDTHSYKWTVDSTGAMDISPENCYLERFTQFEAQTKNADSEALSALVQLELAYFGILISFQTKNFEIKVMIVNVYCYFGKLVMKNVFHHNNNCQ